MATKRTQSEKNSKRGLGFLSLLLIIALGGFDVFSVPSFASSDWGPSGNGTPGIVDDGDAGNSSSSDNSGNSSKTNTGSTTITPNEDRPLDDPFFYARSTLSKDEQKAYDLMYEAFVNRTEMTYSFDSSSRIAHIRDCIVADHPEIIDVEGVSYSTGSDSSTHAVTAIYSMSEDAAADRTDQIEVVAAECLNAMPSGLDDYGKVKYVYDYVIDNTEYGGDTGDGQNIDSTFIEGQTVCAGYAKAFQFLVQRLGISCLFVTGETGEPHGWCVVQIDGEWYVVDPTWGDESTNGASYDYLCITEKEASCTHTLRCTYDVPTCNATASNYFVREGLMLDSVDVAKAGSIVAKAEAEGKPSASFRCSSKEVYDGLVGELIQGRRIYDYMDANEYTYSKNDNLYIVQIFF